MLRSLRVTDYSSAYSHPVMAIVDVIAFTGSDSAASWLPLRMIGVSS